jgi:Ca2+-binding EF-hand superfamily protein
LDRDGNGYIDYAEFRRAMQQMADALSDEEFHLIVDSIDVNKDGKIDYEGKYLRLKW